MPTLNIVGCGRVARTLGRLWSQLGVFSVLDVSNRTQASADEAVRFVGAGVPVAAVAGMRPAQFWLLGVPDREVAHAAEELARCAALREGDAVFHCSGFLASSVLSSLRAAGCRLASAHPVLSFASPERALTQVPGALCGLEGDVPAVAELRAAFEAIGMRCFTVQAEDKPLYHAGSVFASNFLVVILELARAAYLRGGVPEALVAPLMAPLAGRAMENYFALGVPEALTGPAARGDVDVVRLQAQAVAAWDPDAGEAYRALSELAARLSRQRR